MILPPTLLTMHRSGRNRYGVLYYSSGAARNLPLRSPNRFKQLYRALLVNSKSAPHHRPHWPPTLPTLQIILTKTSDLRTLAAKKSSKPKSPRLGGFLTW